MAGVYVGIGSNVDRAYNITRAIDALQNRFGSLQHSGIYESDPVGFKGDPFFNVVVSFTSGESPWTLVSIFRGIEAESGRNRDDPRLGPRTLDLDLLLYDDRVIDRDGVVIPRHEIIEYAFVLCPLAEIAGSQRHPVTGETYADMWSRFDDATQVVRRVASRVADLAHADPSARATGGRQRTAAQQDRADG